MPSASEAALASQRFWDHMDSVTPEAAAAMWKDLLKGVVDREQIDLSSIGYDGTNFYTFLDTFNTRCNLAARGKNKQGRDNLRQVSYALFCTTDGQLPLFYDVYQGNRNDARQFSEVLQRFHRFFSDLSGREGGRPRNDADLRQGEQLGRQFPPAGRIETQVRRFGQTQGTSRTGGNTSHRPPIPRMFESRPEGGQGLPGDQDRCRLRAGLGRDLQPEAGTYSMADLAERHYQGQPAAGRTARAAG